MRRILRGDERGVAAAVATMFALLLVLLFMQATIIAAVPQQQYAAEYNTSLHNLQEFDFLRSMAAGPAVAGTQFSVPFQLGTAASSPFATASQGTLSLQSGGSTGVSVSFQFVPQFRQTAVSKTYQDVILIMDDSGSMAQNDPQNLRITGAQEYVASLTPPDCVAIVAFNGNSWLTQANIGKTPHHLYYPGMCGTPDYSQPIADLGTITDIDNTNIGRAIMTANNELIANGNRNHAWVEILLTDGQNECGGSSYTCGDSYTIQQAQIAAVNNITIYTIGLSSQADANLLRTVAADTGGTYYSAPTASSIRWIYFEISMQYKSTVACGNIFSSEAYGGTLALNLSTSQYPSQSLRFESGGVAVVQSDGAAMYEGLPMQYTPTGGGGGALQIALVSVLGTPFTATGGTTRVINADVLARNVISQSLTRVNLTQEAANVGNIISNVTYWTNQGAATQGAANAVNAPLGQAQTSVQFAQNNATTGNYIGAQNSVHQAQTQLSTAIGVAQAQDQAGNMQDWFAKSIIGQITLESCRLGQWINWYNGLTVTITTPVPLAWANWANTTFPQLKIPFSVIVNGHTVILNIHSLDQITTDRRVIQVSVS